MLDTILSGGSFYENECGQRCRLTAVGASFLVAWITYGLSRIMWQRFSEVYRGLKSDEKAAWDTRTVSTAHSLVTGIWAVICLASATYRMPIWSLGQPTHMTRGDVQTIEDAFNMFERPAGAFFFGGNFQMELMLCVSLGYFLQDSIVIVAVRGALWQVDDLIHHGTILANLSTALIARTFLPYITWVYLAEMSTPLHNMRYYFERTGIRSILLDAAFSITFLLVRPVSFSWMILHIVQHYEIWVHSLPAQFILLIAVAFFGLNYYWTTLVLRAIYDTAFPRRLKAE